MPLPEITHQTIADVISEIYEQPAWRSRADQESDYCDGNQLNSSVLTQMQATGIAPIVENLIGPCIEDICGMEAKNRTDWRVEPDDDNDKEADRVAKAVNYKLNQAEKRSGADRALTKAYASLVKTGIGWVEVSREPDPFKFPYRANYIHRNEVWWDWYSKQDDLSDARWLLRRKWTNINTAMMMFPKHRELIKSSCGAWGNIDDLTIVGTDSGESTNLSQSWEIERGWSVEEQEWKDPTNKRICLFQLLTRDYEEVTVLRSPSGRVVKVDLNNPAHLLAISHGFQVSKAIVSRIRNSIFMGPHKLLQEDSEFDRFNIVRFIGKQEDRTNVPYGTIRWLMPLQDEVNARISKMQWLLSATRTVRTDGAVKMTDEVFRNEIGRPDADIKLSAEHMALAGARFEIDNNIELNAQQYNRLIDLRNAVRRLSGVSEALSGDGGAKTASGQSQMIEQSIQSLATTNDNFCYGRMQVGDLYLKMIMKDIGDTEQVVTIKGNALIDSEEIVLNARVVDEATNQEYLSNDIQRTMLKVALSDVPTTPTFRQQQLSALSEAFKSAPKEYQAIMMPHLMHLLNVPNGDEIVKAIVDINKKALMSEDAVQGRIAQALDQAKTEWLIAQKDRELNIKERKVNAEIEKIVTETVNKAIESIYSATQAGAQIASMPGVARVADQILESAGFQDQDMAPIVAQPTVEVPIVEQRQNTSPMFPPRADTAGEGMLNGIEKPGVQI